MDIFDQYLFEELTTQYSKSGLSADDYEELYQRFCNLDYLKEVRPYLLTMRFFGLGTATEKDTVLSELKAMLNEDDCMLKGLYYDLLLSENSNNTDAIVNLRRMVDEGYTNKFTKEKSHIEKATAPSEVSASQKNNTVKEPTQTDEDIAVDYITFECNGYNGLYFTAGDVDYLYAKVFIKPFHGKKHIKVRSQIFLDGDAFSKVFSNEYDIDSDTRWFKTQGWGNTNFNCYRNNIYQWVIKIDGKTTFSQEFRMYNGKLNKSGPKVNDVKLFASKSSGALEANRDNYKTTFDGKTLEYIYFKFLMDPPGEDMNVQVYIKVTYLEDNSVFRDKYFLQQLNDNTIACWDGIGFSKAGNWKKGLYQYSVHIGTDTKYEGTFTVY
ncbi:hypothetical protein FMM74_022350 [Lachnospiraceae bacterium MD308]|nr:hypothetical protein [Lachnospiraceae bacterium MD308]